MKLPPDSKELFVFAGPNGSGKSTIIKYFFDIDLCPPLYICPDSLLYDDSTDYPIPSESLNSYLEKLRVYLKSFPELLMARSDIEPTLKAYITAMNKAEQLRDYALEEGESFTLETVLSTYEKLRFIKRAQTLGYEITLIYIVTTSPRINIRRIKKRVKAGGHDVPKKKIISRYHKCLELMPLVLGEAQVAFVYDNSKDGATSALPLLYKEHDEIYLLGKGKRNERWVKKYMVRSFKKLGLTVCDLSAEEEQKMFRGSRRQNGGYTAHS